LENFSLKEIINYFQNFLIQNRAFLVNLAIAALILVILVCSNIFLFWILKKFSSFLKAKVFIRIKPIEINGRVLINKIQILSIISFLFYLLRFFIIIFIIMIYYRSLNYLFPSLKNSVAFEVIKGFLLTLITTVIVYLIIKSISRGIGFIIESIERWKGSIINPLSFRKIIILTETQISKILRSLLTVIRIALIAIILYFSIPIIFSYFKFTSTWSDILLSYIMKPIGDFSRSVIQAIPNLFYILVIIFVSRFFIHFARDFFEQIAMEELKFKGFSKEWALPTFKLVRGFLIVFTFIIMFPYLPGSDSEVFRGVSVFVGIVISLGSTSVMSNIVSGLVLTYTNAFSIGDRVKIGETTGDIIEKTLLVTRIRSVKNVVITIPNSIVLNNHMINYSISSKSDDGLILHTAVTIGYDVPWRRVHELLTKAALTTENIKNEPKPFVLQNALNDYHVSYELNCYTQKPKMMSLTYSMLHQKIQDVFNEAGIEILSPGYHAIRDGNKTTVPETVNQTISQTSEKSDEKK